MTLSLAPESPQERLAEVATWHFGINSTTFSPAKSRWLIHAGEMLLSLVFEIPFSALTGF